MEVKEIVRNCLKGEAEAWKMLVDLYSRKIFNLAYQFAGSPQEAEDLTQEIFLKLYNSLGKYDFERDFTAWFLTLARNFLIDEFRRTRLEKSQRADFEEFTTAAAEADGPENRLLSQEKAEMVREALLQLSPELRTVLVLREIEGFSYEEIARKMKLPLGTVKSRVNRGRIQIAQAILEKTGGKP
ncbi:MAG: sigma-70 family RNA polymerase sigma factor [Candidatus Aminicenantes bacterium]|nr:sigma-70 family RNA polymerase sigma factor [Candidatus Aminicenantes bacterium]